MHAHDEPSVGSIHAEGRVLAMKEELHAVVPEAVFRDLSQGEWSQPSNLGAS
ncbi:MAG: hypothetical protein ACJAYU_001409 [Bradymonadia bacterium]|jgi:hypothetical protein